MDIIEHLCQRSRLEGADGEVCAGGSVCFQNFADTRLEKGTKIPLRRVDARVLGRELKASV